MTASIANIRRTEAVARPAGNDNPPEGEPPRLDILRHFAELSLGIAVYTTFSKCNDLQGMFAVILQSDDIERLGLVAASSIAFLGLRGLLRSMMSAVCFHNERKVFEAVCRLLSRQPK